MATGWPMKTTYANGDVYSASDVNDTNGTINLLQTSTLSRAGGKNVIINGGMDIWQPPRPQGGEWSDLYHFMIAKVVPSLKACFKENEYKWDVEDDESKFCFLIAIGGQVFELADDMSISLTDTGFYGVGSGSSYAIGALEAGASLSEALEIAARNDAYTSGPFLYYTQPQPKKAQRRK